MARGARDPALPRAAVALPRVEADVRSLRDDVSAHVERQIRAGRRCGHSGEQHVERAHDDVVAVNAVADRRARSAVSRRPVVVQPRGADGGAVEGRSESMRFERSLRLDDARDSDVLLAYAMNGEPLPVEHGYPMRLIVPRWYAVASVKWLTEIELIDRRFTGHYQGDKYRYEWEREGRVVSEPVTLQRVRALITEPSPNIEVRSGEMAIRGVAWSGAAPIFRRCFRRSITAKHELRKRHSLPSAILATGRFDTSLKRQRRQAPFAGASGLCQMPPGPV